MLTIQYTYVIANLVEKTHKLEIERKKKLTYREISGVFVFTFSFSFFSFLFGTKDYVYCKKLQIL